MKKIFSTVILLLFFSIKSFAAPDGKGEVQLSEDIVKSFIDYIVGDIGTQKSKHTNTAIWYTPVFISKIKLNSKHTIAGRIEYYHDKNEIIIPTATLNGYQTFGASMNYDYQISSKMLWRAELKRYASKDPIFNYAQPHGNHTAATIAFIVRL